MSEWLAYMKMRCLRKRRFTHPGQARRAAHRDGLRAYRCKFCQSYHLTKRGADGGASHPDGEQR